MTDSITIIRAGLEDLEEVVPLFDGYRQFYRQRSEPDRVRAFLADRLRNRDSVIFLARLADRTPAGLTQLYPMFSSVSIGRSLVLNDLFVAPAARGHGVGRALLDRAAAFGRETGALYLELATAVTNTVAQGLYQRAGWRRDTEYHHYSLDLR